ncbi:MAG TPA: lytic transglycosylase domain-containing protein, partial [Thermomonospora sp.]|nr:lytic transglycosylase domain-containing protein [Thermomonospora sp.]
PRPVASGPAGASAEPTGVPGGPVTNVVDAAQVAPLRRVVPPDVLVVGASSISAAEARRVSRLKGVRDVALVAGGAVQLQSRLINTFAVDPSAFRSWTPPATAKRTELWAALAADRFVVSEKAARELRLSPGLRYPIVAKTIPSVTLGGSGDLGLPGIDMLVSARTGAGLGLVPNVALLINAPGADPVELTASVDRLFGGGAKVVNLNEQRYRRPTGYLDLYRRAATTCPGLSWTVLAAIGQVESDHGRNAGRSSAGALGPMQFLPSTWKSFGVDGDGDGKADIMNPYDAIPAAAKYLCAHGGGRGGQSLYQAVYAYNHAHWYVRKVLDLAKAYAARYR